MKLSFRLKGSVGFFCKHEKSKWFLSWIHTFWIRKKDKQKPKQIKPSSLCWVQVPRNWQEGPQVWPRGGKDGDVMGCMQPVTRDHLKGSCSDTHGTSERKFKKEHKKTGEEKEIREQKRARNNNGSSKAGRAEGTPWWSRNPKHWSSTFIGAGLSWRTWPIAWPVWWLFMIQWWQWLTRQDQHLTNRCHLSRFLQGLQYGSTQHLDGWMEPEVMVNNSVLLCLSGGQW